MAAAIWLGISSAAAHFSGGLTPTYNATKAFASNYLNGLRSRAARSKMPISVTTVEPGYVETAMVEGQSYVAGSAGEKCDPDGQGY